MVTVPDGGKSVQCGGAAVLEGAAAEPHVAVRGLRVRRGERCLIDGLTLDVSRGSFIAIVGPSGIGKSSLLYCLSGLLRADSGVVCFRCAEGCAHPPTGYQRRIGFIHQDLRLVPTRTLLDNALCGRLGKLPWWRSAWGFSRAERRAAFAILESLGIAHRAHRIALECSGGEQQRAAVARAILQDPEIFFADEPVSQLDFASARRVLDVLKDLAERRGKTVFCTLHDEHLVRAYASRVIRLHSCERARWALEVPVR
jgi:phosphonate transport system ATP-binding protein